MHSFDISQEFIIAKSVEELHAFYLDLDQFAELHPLIENVHCLNEGKYCYTYEVREKPFRYLPFRIKYKAEIENPSYLKEINYIMTKVPFLQPKISYRFQSLSKLQTKILVDVSVSGSWLFRKLLAKKIMKCQEVIVDSLQTTS